MSKISAIRIINLNYNNNAIKISDEVFEMNGETTLLSLDNGGGKSVLVQMVMAPFVHKRYQNFKDRPFSSYFTTNKPTFILVEWKLDGGTGYVMTGMMVRKNQEVVEDNSNELDMINFICEYKERCNQDIYHIPVVEKTSKKITLKGFNVCKQLFETFKRDGEVPFFYYDMNNASQSRQYFDKLMEYQINYKEWENIIKKVNLKESGLSELFSDCKDEKGLVEKWFLDAVENKLNKEKSKIHEFQNIMEKYIVQYRDNQSKIQRRDAILLFKEEAKTLKQEAMEFEQVTDAKIEQESKIADFLHQMKVLLSAETENKEELDKKIEVLNQEISHLIYEKLSNDFYEVATEIEKHSCNKELMQIEKDVLEREWSGVKKILQTLQCAKQQKQVDEDYRDYLYERERLKICMEKEENLQPEREKLGSQLKCYYSKVMEQLNAQIKLCEEAINGKNEEITKEQQNFETLSENVKTLAFEIGEIKSDLKRYQEEEDRYNLKYEEHFLRNVLGVYEAGMLAEKKLEYENEQTGLAKERTASNRELNNNKLQLKAINRNIQDEENKKVSKKGELKTLKGVLNEYEEEIEERKKNIRYFQISEEKLFDKDEIIHLAGNKLQEINAMIATIQWDMEKSMKEYEKLKQGKVLELSEEFKQMLIDLDIQPVYGMDWLKKNKKSLEQNKKIVEKNPFLPYSLIMTWQELMKLSDDQECVYTSNPVPILVREQLEQLVADSAGPVKKIADINFYVLFNDNLLDEDKLLEMLTVRKHEIEELQERLQIKRDEYEMYNEKREKIRNQKVTLENYEETNSKIKEINKTLKEIDKNLENKHSEKLEYENLQESLESKIKELEKSIFIQQCKVTDFSMLCDAYLSYQENMERLDKKRKEQNRFEGLIDLSKEKTERLNSEILSKSHEKEGFKLQLDDTKKSRQKYQQYDDGYKESLTDDEVMQAESKYIAITSEVSLEKQEIEKFLEKATVRYQKRVDELSSLQTKYHLSEEEWKEVTYSEKEELHQEAIKEEKEKKIKVKENEIQEEEIKIAGLTTKRELMLKGLMNQCQKEQPLPKNKIHVMNFEDEIQAKKIAKNDIEKKIKGIQTRIVGYDNLTMALAEYEEFTCGHEVVWEHVLAELSIDELAKLKGILIRDYNGYMHRMQNKVHEIDKCLDKIARQNQFADEFYKKPIETLMNLTLDATLFSKQLDTILQSFDNLMEKLLVDISFVEKEKEKVIELMEDYLKEVHSNLGKIDQNSTITIRGKSVKMLKIELLDWNENYNIFHLKLQDYVDEVTKRGIETMDQNGNITELLGIKITTNALYDIVVGTANLQIKLYKIEAMREYPITWTDVAKNSGGEGFLSAFVILSSLLCYMRRNDSDLFVTKNEGKVLIMDNPFAQTNASHLLKPLMDIAKKTNTQLICLSGLGGESIYNRFDNIYVLKLIASNLRNGMQYLKSERIRGSEEQSMLVSQIKVVEQMKLEF